MTESIIVARGGGGFSMEPNNLALDQFTVEITSQGRPKVCFVPTVSGDANLYVERFCKGFVKLACEPRCLSLLRQTGDDLRGDLERFSGGSRVQQRFTKKPLQWLFFGDFQNLLR